MSFGRKRNSHGFPMRVSCGSVPPIITGLPSFRMSGAIAWSWVLRMEPMNAGISLSPASLLNARTAPGLVVWSSSMTSSNARPSTPPALFTSSTARFAPLIWNRPDSAPGPVSGATMPIFSLSAAATEDATSAAAARPVAILRNFAFMLSPFALVLWIENSRTGPEVSLGMGAQSIGIIVAGAIEKWPEVYRKDRPAEGHADFTMPQLNSYCQIENRKSLSPELQAARLPFLDRPLEQRGRAVNAMREFAVRQRQEKRHHGTEVQRKQQRHRA